LNAAAALASGLEAGLDFATCAAGLASFAGVDRRFERKGAWGGAEIYDDYGHHPTEVSATLQAFRERFPGRRLVVAFQPHRFSRTKLCWEQFLGCFAGADRLLLLDIYPAGEAAIEGVDSDRLFLEIRLANKARLPSSADRLALLRAELMPGDVLVTLGAGDVYKLGQALADEGAAQDAAGGAQSGGSAPGAIGGTSAIGAQSAAVAPPLASGGR
jgi:UDP-N-acetylmuramate--alanine ligase